MLFCLGSRFEMHDCDYYECDTFAQDSVPVFPKGNASAANWKGWPLLSEPPPPEKRNPPDHTGGKGKGKLPPAPPPPNAKLLDLVSSTLGGVYGDWARDALSSGGPTNPALNVIQSLMQGAAAQQQQQQPLIQPPQGIRVGAHELPLMSMYSVNSNTITSTGRATHDKFLRPMHYTVWASTGICRA